MVITILVPHKVPGKLEEKYSYFRTLKKPEAYLIADVFTHKLEKQHVVFKISSTVSTDVSLKQTTVNIPQSYLKLIGQTKRYKNDSFFYKEDLSAD